MNTRSLLESTLRRIREFFQDQWFDRTRRVRTSGDVSLRSAGIDAAQSPDSELYVPARPAHIRQALRAMPVGEDVSGFRYIDLGCGKGRSLFVAAELPFREIVGVELSELLYGQCCRNIRSFRPWRRHDCPAIRSLHENATEFQFPEGDLVLYLFNPFGAATMARVLQNLDAARRRHPCRVVVILLWPRCGDQVLAIEGMRLCCRRKEYEIFEALPLCQAVST